jgi:hypothetical protein
MFSTVRWYFQETLLDLNDHFYGDGAVYPTRLALWFIGTPRP